MKKWISVILCLAMILQSVPLSIAEKPVSAAYETVQTEKGTTLRSQLIDGDLVLDEKRSLYLDGILTLNHGSVIITGGRHTISRDAVIRGNIIVSGPADVTIDGIVEGDLLLNWNRSLQENSASGNLHVTVGEHAVLHGIRSGIFQGNVDLFGSVTTVEVGDEKDPLQYESTGFISFFNKAFADRVIAKGRAVPQINVHDEALVGRMNLSGGASLYMEKGRINELTVTDGADAGLHFGNVKKLDASGAGIWIWAEGAHVGQVTISNPTFRFNKANIEKWYDENHTVMTAMKGTTVDSLSISGYSSFSANNTDGDEVALNEGVPIGSLDKSQLFRETRIGSVVASGPVCLENGAYMESVVLENGVEMWGSGMTKRLESKDSNIFCHRTSESFEHEFYNIRVLSVFNEEYYHGVSVGYGHIKGGHILFASGTGAGTLVVENANVGLCEFERINNLVLHNVREFYLSPDGAWNQEGIAAGFARPETIDRLFFNSSSWRVRPEGSLAMHIGTLSVFQSPMTAFADVDRLILPDRQTSLSSGITGRVVQGVRPGPAAEDPGQVPGQEVPGQDQENTPAEGQAVLIQENTPAEGQAVLIQEKTPAEGQPVLVQGDGTPEETLPDYYVGEVITTRFQNGSGLTKGRTSRKDAEKLKLQNYVIRKNNARDWWYTLETRALQTLNISFGADEGMGLLTVYGPDGQLETLVSDGASADLNMISERGGVWTLCVTGSVNDYHLGLSANDPVRIALQASVQDVNSRGNGKKRPLDPTGCHFEIENVTRGTKPVFIVTPEEIVMATDQAGSGDTLNITMLDPEDEFVPVTAEVHLNKSLQAKARLETAEYGRYVVTCKDSTDVSMHLYDGQGAYLRSLSGTNGTYRAEKLLPGTYQLVMIRGSAGHWRFSRLSDYAEYGMQEGRDYRLDTFTLRKGYEDSYPGATVPDEPVLDSAYAVEGSGRFDAAKSVCLENGSVLMRAEYELENTDRITDCSVEIELSGIRVNQEAVTLDGNPVACTMEGNTLLIPLNGQSKGRIAFYACSTDQDEMLAIARLRIRTDEGDFPAYLGSAVLEKKNLSIHASPESGGTVNLFGYGIPGETLALLRDGVPAAYTECDMNGEWAKTLHIDTTEGYETYQFAVAAYSGTSNEIISDPVSVRVQSDTPALTSVELYYYEHEIQRKLFLTAEQFFRGGLTYNYLPGSAFTFRFAFDHAERIEELSLVLGTKAGDEIVIPCTRSEQTGVFSASGEFPRASMNNTLRLDWRLAPLPEPSLPDPPDQAAIDQAFEMTGAEAVHARLADQEFLEYDVKIRAEGVEDSTATVQFSMGAQEYDMELLQEEAIARYRFDDGGIAYLTGDPLKPETFFLVFVSAEDVKNFHLNASQNENLLETIALQTGLLSEASASDDGFANALQTGIAFGAIVVFDVATAMAGSVVKVFAYDAMMAGTYRLRNRVDDQWARILNEMDKETSPKRRLCLSSLSMKYAELRQHCTDVADEYSKKATTEGILSLLPTLLNEKTLKATRNFVSKSENLKNLKGAKQEAIDVCKAVAETTQEGLEEQMKILKRGGNDRYFDKLKEMVKNNRELIDNFRGQLKAYKDGTRSIDEVHAAFNDMLANLGSDSLDLRDKFLELKDDYDDVRELMDAVEEADRLEKELQEAEENLHQAEKELEEIDSQIEEESKEFFDQMKELTKETVREIAEMYYDDFYKDLEDTRKAYENLLDEECPLQPDSTPLPEPAQTGIVAPNNNHPDPSGYVYEAMWTNRIPGVTASAYTQDAAGRTVLWDAESYGQKNPTVTDEQGYYEWYVPEGLWKVTYEKEGYERAESEWMTVPPPQTEVHQNLISYQAPQVLYARHYGDEVEIAFTRPVIVESVNAETVSTGMKFNAQAVNPERYGDTDITLATVFRLIPEKKLPQEITVSVSGGVSSYAGVPCEGTSLKCTKMARLEGISVPSSVEAKTGTPLTITVQAWGGDFDRYSLQVTGAHEDLMRTDRIGAFDAKGTAVIELTPLASGTVLLDIHVADTDISTAVKVTISE